MADRGSAIGLTGRLAGWTAGRWKVIAGTGGVLGAALAAMAAYYQVAGPTARVLWALPAALFGGATGSGGVLVLYLLLRHKKRLRDAEAELRALVNVRPLTGKLPLDLGGWAVNPVPADRMTRLLFERRPRLVVECGSGWSTVLMALCLRELSEGRVVALEHLERFADRTRTLLRRYGVADRAEVIHAPIEDVRVDGETWPWYGVDPQEAVDGPVEVLLVDGPPGNLAPRSRYPAVPLFADQLAESWAVVLDDGHREDESWIAERWGRRLGVAPTFEPAGQGVFVFESAPWTDVPETPRTGGPAV